VVKHAGHLGLRCVRVEVLEGTTVPAGDEKFWLLLERGAAPVLWPRPAVAAWIKQNRLDPRRVQVSLWGTGEWGVASDHGLQGEAPDEPQWPEDGPEGVPSEAPGAAQALAEAAQIAQATNGPPTAADAPAGQPEAPPAFLLATPTGRLQAALEWLRQWVEEKAEYWAVIAAELRRRGHTVPPGGPLWTKRKAGGKGEKADAGPDAAKTAATLQRLARALGVTQAAPKVAGAPPAPEVACEAPGGLPDAALPRRLECGPDGELLRAEVYGVPGGGNATTPATNGRAAPRAGRLVPPLKYHGGKKYVAKAVLGLMPPHLCYVEPFFGGGQVLFARDPYDRRLWWQGLTSDKRRVDGVAEFVNDLWGDLMNFYAALKDPTTFAALRERLDKTLHAEAEWGAACRLLAGPDGDPVTRAAALFTSIRQSLSARGKSYAPPVTTRLRGGREDGVNAWWSAIEGLEVAHKRLQSVRLLCRPAVKVIEDLDLPSTLFYLDPPYHPDARAAPNVYGHEMSDADHRQLLDVLLNVKGRVILSGYAVPLYDRVLASWNRRELDLANHASGAKKKRRMMEVLWCNFGE
jgi:DNA adenine methylase